MTSSVELPQRISRRRQLAQNDITVIDGLRTASVGEDGSPRQALVFMGIMAWVEPFELQRLSVLAEAWNARVAVVDVPGCGHGGARLTPSQRRALRRGEFAPVARQMVHCAQARNPRLRRGPVIVVGYSLGASLAAAVVADPGLMRVSGLMLVEPVALRRWRVSSLLRSIRSENQVVDDHVNQNHGLAAPPRRGEPTPPWSRIDVAHLGYAVSRGRLGRDLITASQIQSVPVQVVHGVDSTLSRPDDVRRLVRRCRRAGQDVRDMPVAGRHALWHSLSTVAELAERTGDMWD